MTPARFTTNVTALFLLQFVVPTASSQQDSTISATPAVGVERGSECLQFHLVGQFSISYEYYLSSQSALRLTADVSGFFRKEEENYEYSNPQEDRSQGWDRTINRQDFRIDPSYLYYFTPVRRASIYIGAGPFLRFSRTHDETTFFETNPEESSLYEGTTTTWQYGLLGTAGVECQLTEQLSVIAEYQISAGYSPISEDHSYNRTTQGDPPYTTSSSRSVKAWEVKLSSLKVGIGVYL